MCFEQFIKTAIQQKVNEYQPSGEGGTRSLPATPQRLQNPKWPPGGPKIAEGVWKGVYLQVFGRSKQLSQNKFLDPSTPSMRKGRDGGKTNAKKTGKLGEKRRRKD